MGNTFTSNSFIIDSRLRVCPLGLFYISSIGSIVCYDSIGDIDLGIYSMETSPDG